MHYVPALHLETFDFVGRLLHWIEDLRIDLARREAYERTCRELSALTDRELADIGLDRSEIASAAARGA